jgi:predicted transcriptional regulator
MNTTAQKLDLIHWITELDDAPTLQVLEIIKEQRSKDDWWNSISDAEKDSIEKGLADAGEGRVVPHAEVKKRYEKWLKD